MSLVAKIRIYGSQACRYLWRRKIFTKKRRIPL